MNPYEYALENYALRIEREYGVKPTFNVGTDEEGGWCESFFNGFHMDKAWAGSGIDEAIVMHTKQPIRRAAYDQMKLVRFCQ